MSDFSINRAIFIIACIQFVNIVDFMMVMPLGVDFVNHLSIATDQIGWITGSYTLSAALAGIILSSKLDNWNRKTLVILCSTGLAVSTFLTAFVWDITSLMFMRLLAGVFGGLVTSTSLAMVIDIVPVEKRGKAIGTVMSAFSIASIVGVPIGLELALRFNWNTPFFMVGILGVIVSFFAYLFLPHAQSVAKGIEKIFFKSLISKKVIVYGYMMIATVMFTGFLIIPFITNYFVFNLNLPREEVGLVYFFGGIASLITMQLTGRMVDSYGAMFFSLIGTSILVVVLLFGFYTNNVHISAYLITILFMVGMNMRGITNQIVLSKIPAPEIRAGYMSLQNAIQHIATTAAAIVGSIMMVEDVAGNLIGMSSVAVLALVTSIIQPWLIWKVKRSNLSYEPIK